MAKGTVNWDSQETWQRIVAAIIATGVKVSEPFFTSSSIFLLLSYPRHHYPITNEIFLFHRLTTRYLLFLSSPLPSFPNLNSQQQVAIHFGTTYDTIQHRFRTIKIEAIVLKEQVERGERLDESSGTPKQKKTKRNNSSSNSTTATPKSTPKKDTLSCKSAFLSFFPLRFSFLCFTAPPRKTSSERSAGY